ncbi:MULTISPECIES: GlxA family transcriptional regulator [Streptomyces]|uniref:Transcriptional regulator, AraC family n=3 Tax=Streptomyces venezuelae TaxID=54571 RepID=F2RGI8_STRVP|nr:helix-turn-helix domain-containing protein [Streptomyces venezuelae]APE20857.1 AraC family transcriptional regulator [Streptomyces venezuelae]QER98253.1 helix-turn-helix domain-containing protein [Streptomyces venezuelae ATCC 10712]CCA54799.1 Transcriptional regulator, AraC family [Streptomyces venezuelae ATCC 10712]
MPVESRVRRVAVIAAPPVSMFNLAIPEMLFGKVEIDGAPGYETVICAPDPGPVPTTGGLDLVVPHGLDAVAGADTVVLAGSGSYTDPDRRILDALRGAAAAGSRIASICTGAFALAEAGLLDGRAATTYWAYSSLLAARHPTVDLQDDVLFVQDGPVLTSSGYAAGIDLCLHVIRTDFGAAVANTVARLALVAPVRPGGQTQFTQTPLPPERGASFADTRAWAMEHLDEPLGLTDLARHAGVSVRTLSRRFHAETGVSPLQWLLHQRVERAKELLETTSLAMDGVARASGLGTADSLRQHLLRRTGLTPSAYRSSFSRLTTPAPTPTPARTPATVPAPRAS